MSEKIYKASVTGIDGSGKTTTVHAVASMLGKTFSIGVLASLSEPSYVVRRGEQTVLFPDLASKVLALYENGQEHHNPLALFAAFLSHIFVQGRVIEPYIIKNYDPDYLVQDRHRQIDSVIMSHFYWLGGIPSRAIVSMVEAVGGKGIVDDVVLLTVSPETASLRVKRKTTSDYHESIENLKRIANLYPAVITQLALLGRINTWTCIDSEINPPTMVSHAIYSRWTNRKV
ncbi:hypothetical protein HY612_02080 [Candidatus Roizmanbacteria bacterium]|nr:hypothetical protein [Candidatus Roizmanbacteria bacterium]